MKQPPLVAVAMAIGTVIVTGQSADALSIAGARCGATVCALSQFCSQLAGNRCEECSTICDPQGHNFEMALCTKSCQDYLHDIRFARKGDPGDDEAMKATIQNLQFKISVITIIISIVIVLLLLVGGVICCLFIKGNYKKFSWSWIRKNKQTPKKVPKKASAAAEVIENHRSTAAKQPGGELAASEAVATSSGGDAESGGGGGVASGGAVFTLQAASAAAAASRRQPAEDVSLDFSYDNMALHLTPTASGPRQQQLQQQQQPQQQIHI